MGKPLKIPEVLRADELARILGELEAIDSPRGVRNLAMVRLLLDTGLRAAELFNLRHRDLDLATGRLWVREGKGKKDRGLWFNGSSRGALQSWLDLKATLPCGGNFSPAAYFFTDLTGKKPICGRWLRKLVARLADQAGIAKRIHPHTLRHSFATDLLRDTKNLFLVSKALGHSNISTTQIYLHLADPELEDAMKNLRGGGQ
jgi:site-specific recombinase XerD